MDISERLRAARAVVGKTQEQVAAEAGMNITQYNGYERGRSRPALPTLHRLAAALNTTVAELESERPAAATSGPTQDIQSLVARLDNLRQHLSKTLGLPVERVHVQVTLS